MGGGRVGAIQLKGGREVGVSFTRWQRLGERVSVDGSRTAEET